MARPLRIEYPGAFYHVTSRGNERKPIFRDDKDRLRFLDILSQAIELFHLRLHAYVLMDNHYHLFLETLQGKLNRASRHLNGVYTQYFNRRHGRVGHLFQGRYKAILVEKDLYLMELSRYIHLNPWRVKRSQDPFHYAWSSLRAYTGSAKVPGWLTVKEVLAYFGRGDKRAYRNFVREGISRGIKTPWGEVQGQALMGSERFVEEIVEKFVHGRELRGSEVSGMRGLSRTVGPEEVLRQVSRHYGMKGGDIKKRSQEFTEARYIASYLLRKYCLLSLREVGEKVGLHYSAASNVIRQVRESPTPQMVKFLRKIEDKIKNQKT